MRDIKERDAFSSRRPVHRNQRRRAAALQQLLEPLLNLSVDWDPSVELLVGKPQLS